MTRRAKVLGRECSGLRVAALERSVPRRTGQECPGKSARERVLGEVSSASSTRYPEDEDRHSRERVLGEVNSTPEHSVPRRPREAPKGPTDEVSACQRSKAAFNECAWPDISNCSRRGVSSCHVLAERREAINCTGPVPYHPAYLGITSQGSRHFVCRPVVVEKQDRAGTSGCSAAARWALLTALLPGHLW